VLEFHELQICGDQIEIAKIGLADDLVQRPPERVKSNGPVERLVFADVKFGLKPVQSGKTRLRVQIDRQDSIPPQRQILAEMRRRRRLPAAAFEIDDGDDLQFLRRLAPRKVFALAFAVCVEVGSQRLQILCRICSTAVRTGFHGRPFALEREASKMTVVGPYPLRSFP